MSAKKLPVERESAPCARPFFYATRTKIRDDMDETFLRVVGPVTMAFRCRVCERTSAWRPNCFWGCVKCAMCDSAHEIDWSRVGSA